VDSMDLMDSGEKDEEGNRQPWFNTLESYNPSIHRVKQAMFHCAITNDVASDPLPPPHPELLKFFDPPKRVVQRVREPLEECRSVFKVKEVLKRVGKAKKDGHHAHAQDDDENLLLLDQKATVERAPTRSESKLNMTQSPRSPRKGKQTARARNADDSDTEEDENDLFGLKKPSSTPEPLEQPLPTPKMSLSPSDVDPGRAPGRIVGKTYPLKDFEKNIAKGDVVTKAVQDLADVITEVVLKPFATRRQGEMIGCMKVLRKTCLEEDEIHAWNSFLHDLKEICINKTGNPSFWKELCELGRELSLITSMEAKKLGGESNVTEKEASEFISSRFINQHEV